MMRVSDLRKIVQDVERVFRASGAKSQQTAVGRVGAALQGGDAQDLDTFLEALEGELDYARRLQEAGDGEQAFKTVFSALEADRTIKKADLIRIASDYTGSADPRASSKKLLKHIKTYFYTKLYERDAREFAKRATPV